MDTILKADNHRLIAIWKTSSYQLDLFYQQEEGFRAELFHEGKKRGDPY